MTEVQPLLGKRLLILDGTRIACEIVRQAQRMGVIAVVADYNAPAQAPAKQVADEHHLVDLFDVDAVVELIRREKLDGVMAGFSDKLLPYYAEICERTGLPCYGSKELFRIFTDKDVYKDLCRQFGVPTIPGYSLADFSPEAPTDVRYPVIVKPTKGSGSKGVKVCRNADEVLEATTSTATSSDKFVIEQYLTGPEATVFWVFQDGEHYVSAVANRHVVRFNNEHAPLPFAYTMPSSITPTYLDEVAPRAREMFSSVGVRDGMMFMQGINDNGVLRLYDIGFRVTGTQEYRLIEAISGYNPLGMLIEFALTGSSQQPNLDQLADPLTGDYGYNVSVLMHPGRVASIEGLDQARHDPTVLSAITTRDAGDTLPPEAAGQLRQVTARILGTAQSPEQLSDQIRVWCQTVRVVGVGDVDLTIDPEPISGLAEQLR